MRVAVANASGGRRAAKQSRPNGTFCPQPQRRFVLIAAILASALGFIDGSVVSIAIPAIRADLGATLADAQWISNAYALTLSALILAGGAAGDSFGLRQTFVAGIALFMVASLACAVAPDAGIADRARAVQGIGAAIMVPGSLAIIAKAYPKEERGRAIGIWAASSALTTALGPVIGGLVLSAFDDWHLAADLRHQPAARRRRRSICCSPRCRPTRRPNERDARSRRRGARHAGLRRARLRPDRADRGRRPDRSPLPLACVVAGLVVFVGFIVWERRQRDPMVELALFRIGAFSGANVATFFLYFALSAILFYLPMLLIAGWGLSAAEAGFIFLPLSAGDRAAVRTGRQTVRPDRAAAADCGWQPGRRRRLCRAGARHRRAASTASGRRCSR